jgi:peptidoglycan hydrolase-like protein with peptidoglycan-binding domain
MDDPDRPKRPVWPTMAIAALIVVSLTGGGVIVWQTAAEAPTPPARPTTEVPSPSPSPSVEPSPEPEPEPRLPNRRLQAGQKGPAVRLLQTLLADLGYDVGEIDGRFGDDTFHAVVALQKVHGLERDGVVGATTRAVIESAVPPKPRHTKRKGTAVEVDLTKQVLYLLRDGKIVRIVDVSTGGGYSFVSRGVRKVAITVTGEYEVYLRYDGWYESSVGPMYKSSFYLRGFAIHGSASVPPYPASHGCVRVTMSGIERLWPHLGLGTRVSVYRS